MDEKNPLALALGGRRALAKAKKIKELAITPKMTEDAIDSLIELLAKAKAERDGVEWKSLIKGQRWYVEDLIKFAGLSGQDKLDIEYSQAFPDVATEDELLLELEALSA